MSIGQGSAARLLYQVVAMAILFLLCVGPAGFLNPDVMIKGLAFLSLGFFSVLVLHSVPIKSEAKKISIGLLFDLIIATALVYLWEGIGPQFSFLLLVPILISGLGLERQETIRLAFMASILFSGSQLLQAEVLIDPVSFSVNQASLFLAAGFSALFRTQTKRVEKALEIVDAELDSLKNLNDLIVGNIAYGIITTSPIGKITFSNVLAKEILEANDLVGKPVRFVNHVFAEAIERERLAKKENLEFKIERTKHEAKVVLFSVTPMIDRHAGHLGFLFLLQDVTDLRALEAQLRQKEKLAAVGQLAAGIAHEIRNPLASISGSIQMLISPGKTEEEIKLGKIVLREIDRLNNLINEFLDFARPPQVGTDALDINAILHEVSELLKLNKQINHGVEAKEQFVAKRLVIGDKNKYKQALLNVIINAYQAMTKSSEKRLIIKTFDHEDRVVVEIEDSGQGIPEQELTKIFEPFHTTKVGGTGLGLAITHKIFEAHGVEVSVSSRVQVGTKFTLRFPCVPLESIRKKIGGSA